MSRWVMLLCFSALAVSAETLTLATYNLNNYCATDRVTGQGYRPAYPKPESEKQALRHVIETLNADVLLVQEIGGSEHMNELQQDLRSEGCDYPYVHVMAGKDQDRMTGVLARRPWSKVEEFSNLDFKYENGRETVKRGLLRVVFETEAGALDVFVVHLKSRYTDLESDPESKKRRAGEAVAIRDQILKLHPDPSADRFLIMGDCNDLHRERPLRALTRRGKTEIASLLDAADSRGEVWTHFYAKEETYSRIDYVMASPALMPWVLETGVCDVPETLKASDHRPVWVRLNW